MPHAAASCSPSTPWSACWPRPPEVRPGDRRGDALPVHQLGGPGHLHPLRRRRRRCGGGVAGGLSLHPRRSGLPRRPGHAGRHRRGEKPAPARIFMHGQPTFKFAVKAVPYCIDQVLEKAVMAIEDVDFFVFHQANARIIDLAAKKYHIPRRSTTRTSRNTATPPPPASPWSSVSSMTWERWGPAPGSWWWASAAASPGAAPWWKFA